MWLATVVILIAGVLFYFIKPLWYWSNKGVRQSNPLPFFGDSAKLIFRKINLYDFVKSFYDMYPNTSITGIYNFRAPVLMIKDPELIKQVAVKDFDSFTDHAPSADPDADPLWCNNLFALTGDRWKEMRNLVSPTFTTSKIKIIYELMADTAEQYIKHFQAREDEVIEIEMKDVFSRFANDVIATTAFGVKVNSLEEKQNIFHRMGEKIVDFKGFLKGINFVVLSFLPRLSKILGLTLLDKEASQYFRTVINDTIKVREENNIVRPDMINLLLEARKSPSENSSENEISRKRPKHAVSISNDEITSQAVIFFFAGFDTISTAMCFGAYELALNKEIQDKLREEIRKTTPKVGRVTYDQLQHMRYMDMVISEVLRKWPPFPMIDRISKKPYTIEPTNKNEKPVVLEAGIEVWFPIYALHRDPKYFPNPDKFDPERFSEENNSLIIPYTYIPFGAGPRLCIGNRFALIEIKSLFFNLLSNFEIVPTQKTPIPLVLKKDFQIGVESGFWLGLKRIKSPSSLSPGN
nr:cytochrome P450 CYP9AZ1 [Dendroctonus valens]